MFSFSRTYSTKYVLRPSAIFKCLHISYASYFFLQIRVESLQTLFTQNILQLSKSCNNFWTWIVYHKPDRYFRTMSIAKSLSTYTAYDLYWEEEYLFLTCLFKLFYGIDNPHSGHFTIGKLLPFIFPAWVLIFFNWDTLQFLFSTFILDFTFNLSGVILFYFEWAVFSSLLFKYAI